MTIPRLSQRIAEAGLSRPVARTFAASLREVVVHDPDEAQTKQALIRRLTGLLTEDRTAADRAAADGGERAPFEALWPHAELFLTACVYVAVTDGSYGVEEARVVSNFAHRLGLSARQLAGLEARAFDELQVRGAEGLHRDRARGLAPAGRGAPDATSPEDAPEPAALRAATAASAEDDRTEPGGVAYDRRR